MTAKERCWLCTYCYNGRQGCSLLFNIKQSFVIFAQWCVILFKEGDKKKKMMIPILYLERMRKRCWLCTDCNNEGWRGWFNPENNYLRTYKRVMKSSPVRDENKCIKC